MKTYILKTQVCGGKDPACVNSIKNWLNERKINYHHSMCRHDCYGGTTMDLWCPEVARGCIEEHHRFEIDNQAVKEFEKNWLPLLSR
jgi:hypothetical protein